MTRIVKTVEKRLHATSHFKIKFRRRSFFTGGKGVRVYGTELVSCTECEYALWVSEKRRNKNKVFFFFGGGEGSVN